MNVLKTNKLQTNILLVVSIALPLLIYTSILLFHIPKEIGLTALLHLPPMTVIPILLLLYLAYRLNGWKGTLVAFSLTLALFALPLSGVWNSGLTDGSFTSGLLPFSDASGYYYDARRLLEGELFSSFSSRRPLFPGMLATLLGLTQQNLQITLAILVLMTAISCFLLTREVQHSHGTLAGLIVLAILFLCYRPYIGTTLTEHLGLSLGTVGFAMIWRGAGQKHINIILLGIFLLTLGLNARAGAFFVLPALILWGTYLFREQSRISWRFLLGGFSAVFLGFLVNLVVLKSVGSPEGVAFSNFSYTLYGQAVGGKGWGQVMIDYPEAREGKEIYLLAFEAIRANPFLLMKGVFKAWYYYFSPSSYGLFSFIQLSYYPIPIRLSLLFLSIVGFVSCYFKRQNSYYSLMLATTLGIFFSIPFIPPIDAGIRLYVTTMPISAILVMLGVIFLVERFKVVVRVGKDGYIASSREIFLSLKVSIVWTYQTNRLLENMISPKPLILFGIGLAAVVFFGPIIIRGVSNPPQFIEIPCSKEQETAYVRLSSGSLVSLVDDGVIPQTHLPLVRISDFRIYIHINSYIGHELKKLTPPTTMMNTFDLKNGRYIWLIADSRMIPEKLGIVRVCGNFSTDTKARNYAVFYASSVQSVSEIQ